MNFKIGSTTLLFTCLALSVCASKAFSAEGLHYINRIEGEVEIKRRWLPGYRQASVGDALNTDDQIRVRDNSTATVKCSNLSTWEVGPGTQKISEGCNELLPSAPDIPPPVCSASRGGIAPSCNRTPGGGL